MLLLRDTVEIEATPDQIYDWFLHLEANYRSWHSAHVSCSYISGRPLEDGAVLVAEEYLFGRLFRLRFTLKEVEPRREFAYRIFPGVRGGFLIQEAERGTELVADIMLGWSIPLVGPFVDMMFRSLFSRQLAAIREHMREEGVNLRALLSQGSPSAM